MTIACRKSQERASAAQWNLDVLLDPGCGSTPGFFSVVPTWCTFQTVSGEEGEKLLAALIEALGTPDGPPQVVKGGSCGGEEEDGDFPFTGAMVSVTWTFPKEEREAFIAKIRRAIGPCAEAAA